MIFSFERFTQIQPEKVLLLIGIDEESTTHAKFTAEEEEGVAVDIGV